MASDLRIKKSFFIVIILLYLGMSIINLGGKRILSGRYYDASIPKSGKYYAWITFFDNSETTGGYLRRSLGQIPFILGGADHEYISLWYDDCNECYILFLPSFCDDAGEVSFRSESGERISVKGYDNGVIKVKELLTGEKMILTDSGEYSLLTLKSENLPAIFIETDKKSAEKLYEPPYTKQEGGNIRIIDKDGTYALDEAMEGIRVRGNTSADWPKKPYQINLNKAEDLFGMGAAVRWNLLSNWSDKSFLRNKITYDMAVAAGMPYSPESCFADLYINGEYQGNYQLTEKIEPGSARVDINNILNQSSRIPNDGDEEFLSEDDSPDKKELSQTYRVKEFENGIKIRSWDMQSLGDDLSGGYILELERPSRIYASNSFFITKRGQPVTVKKPEFVSEEQAVYLSGLWQEFEDALFSEDGINPGTGKHYFEYADMESLAKKYLVEEIVRNYDASSTSQYFYKDSDRVSTLFYAGPVWDYDMSLGNPIMNPATNQNYISSVSPYGLYAAQYMDDFTLWARLYEHEDFRAYQKDCYKNVFYPLLKDLEDARIDDYAGLIRKSAGMDNLRWRSKDINIKKSGKEKIYEGYDEAIDILKVFLNEREKYLTGYWLDGRTSVKVYLSAGEADLYVSYVENLVGEPLYEPPAPELAGWDFLYWTDGYSQEGEPYEFGKPYDGSPLYLAAVYENDKKERYITYLE